MAARRSSVSPPRVELQLVEDTAASCTACDLYKRATQTVFGNGAVPAPLMLVGEQPGSAEDKAGAPFVGPAGRVLDEAIDMAGINRERLYVTNAVKHFKWQARGKARIHKKPSAAEVDACHPWLERELALVDPQVVVAMGATAGRSLFGKPMAVTANRGRVFRDAPSGVPTIVTIHPSAILRAQDPDDRHAMMDMFVADLTAAETEVHRQVA